MLTIGELSERTGASHRSLRHYELFGILEPERRANGYRYYDETDVARVDRTKALLSLGLPLRTIQEVMDCVSGPSLAEVDDCPELREALTGQLLKIEQQANEILQQRDAITAVLHGSMDRQLDAS
jgi:DNA-binding transcriptional MerR regulator